MKFSEIDWKATYSCLCTDIYDWFNIRPEVYVYMFVVLLVASVISRELFICLSLPFRFVSSAILFAFFKSPFK